MSLAKFRLVASLTVVGALAVLRGSPAERNSADVLEVPPRNILVNDPSTDEFPYITQIEPTLAVSGSTIVVGWNDSGHSAGLHIGVGFGLGYGYSTDGGETFRDAGGLADPGGLDGKSWGADPTLAVDRFGDFYFGRFAPMESGFSAPDLLGSVSGVTVYKSYDRGATFQQLVPPFRFRGLSDKPFVAVDNTRGRFDGNVYLTWADAAGVLTIMLSRSTDGGATFSTPIRISVPGNNNYSMPAIGPNGEVFVLWLAQDTNKIYLRKSIDGGLTFDPEVLVASVTRPGSSRICAATSRSGLNGNIRVSNIPVLAVETSSSSSRGNMYIVFSAKPDPAGPDMADVFLVRSTDGGQTWSEPRRINDDGTTNDQWLPFVTVADNGAVGVMWYDRRADDQNLLIDVYMAVSTDGGASFSRNFRITDVSFPVPDLFPTNFDPRAASACYMGSYNFMVVDEDSFYLAWTDNRLVASGKPDPNIFFAKVPVPVVRH